MVIDSSAIVAILLEEPDMNELLAAIDMDPVRFLSAGTYLEAGIVLDGLKRGVDSRTLDQLVELGNFEVVPMDRDQAEIARAAYRRFGKGNHRAKLNLGDCFSYALAKQSGEPLLFKGDDFTRTDIESAIPSKGKHR